MDPTTRKEQLTIVQVIDQGDMVLEQSRNQVQSPHAVHQSEDPHGLGSRPSLPQ